VAEWSTGVVERVALQRRGSSYRSTVSTFLDGLHNPTALVLLRDDSLLVGDWGTGTIYRIAKS